MLGFGHHRSGAAASDQTSEGDEDQSVTGDDTILRGGRFGQPQVTT